MEDNNFQEKYLYKPMANWLNNYLFDKYPKLEIIVEDTSEIYLDKILRKFGIINNEANGLQIQIDILGIVKKNNEEYKLFFIEAKKNDLTLKDLGQLWIYCKLINPEEAFLMGPKSMGGLGRTLQVLRRTDLLNYGINGIIKNIKVVIWNTETNSPKLETMILRCE